MVKKRYLIQSIVPNPTKLVQKNWVLYCTLLEKLEVRMLVISELIRYLLT